MRKLNLPFVVEKHGDNERSYDVYSRLLEDRIIFIGEEITNELANSVVAQLLLLDQRDPSSDIYLYINSPGGSITSGLAIYDTINFIRPEVRTVCVGIAASMAAVLLASGKKFKRYALPNSKIMIHQPRQQNSPQAMTVTEQEIDLAVIKDMKKQLTSILAEKTGKSYKKIWKDCELDTWMNPAKALEYGLIDEIIIKKPE